MNSVPLGLVVEVNVVEVYGNEKDDCVNAASAENCKVIACGPLPMLI